MQNSQLTTYKNYGLNCMDTACCVHLKATKKPIKLVRILKRRKDENMLGITCEGGGSRTIYSCGVLDVLLEEKIIADYFIGVSAGIAFGVSYCSNQIGRNLNLATKFMNSQKYSGIKHLFKPKNRSYYNMDYVYETIPNVELPFDFDAFADFKGEVIATVTNVKTGKAEYLPVPRDDRKFTYLRASCALPLLFPEIEIGGEKYLDGGIADSIPYMQSLNFGCDKNIIILTRPQDYIKEDEPATKLAVRKYKKYPEFCEAMETRAKRYNQCIEEIKQLKSEGKVFVFTPKSTFNVGRTEGNPVKLKRLYEHGYNHAKWALDDLKKYLSK